MTGALRNQSIYIRSELPDGFTCFRLDLLCNRYLVLHNQDGRVVKALALRSNGRCPRGFEPHSW